MSQAPLVIEPVVSAPFQEVSYILWRRGTTDTIVVDPGFEPDEILEFLEHRGLKVVAILNTHGHADHIAGNFALKTAFPNAPLIIGRNEAHLLLDPAANLSALYGFPLTSPPADRLVEDGERFSVAGIEFLVHEIPGHSPGSVVFLVENDNQPIVLGGDVLFAGSVGRVDLPGGDGPRLVAGIREKLLALPDGTVVLPGHGPATTIGAERVNNPFVGDHARLDQIE